MDQVTTTVVQVNVDDGAISEWEGYREAGRGGNPRGLAIHTQLRNAQGDMFGFRGGMQEIRTTQTNLTNNKAPYKHDDDQYWVSSWVFDRDRKRVIVIMRTMTYDKYKQLPSGPRLFHRFTSDFDGVETYVERCGAAEGTQAAAVLYVLRQHDAWLSIDDILNILRDQGRLHISRDQPAVPFSFVTTESDDSFYKGRIGRALGDISCGVAASDIQWKT